MRGTTVTLYEETITGYDSFNAPIVTLTPVEVENVLVGEPSTDDITSSVSSSRINILYKYITNCFMMCIIAHSI